MIGSEFLMKNSLASNIAVNPIGTPSRLLFSIQLPISHNGVPLSLWVVEIISPVRMFMTNHPNRGRRSAASNPTPAEILKVRTTAGLTQTEAAALIYRSRRSWQEWEAGDQRMDPALWELFNLKITGGKPQKAAR